MLSKVKVRFSNLWLQEEEGEVTSDQSLKEFEGATLRYASINLKYVSWKQFNSLVGGI